MKRKNYTNLITFFKKHNLYDEEIFKQIYQNAIMFDYRDDDMQKEIGCYTINVCKKLKHIIIVVPYIEDEKTLLINIHEYTHALLAYKKIGKEYTCNDNLESEIIALLYEKIYLIENPSPELENYINYLNQKILQSNDINSKISLQALDELLNYYLQTKNHNKTVKKSKKLLKKYRKKNVS